MSPQDAITRQLLKRFAEPGPQGRVVIWTDPEADYEAQVDALTLPDVTVLHVRDNEFAIKRRVLITEPKTKFLIYRGGPRPASDVDNWLLDLDLAYEPFTTDRTSLVVQEFGAGQTFRQVVDRYPAYFKSAKRNEALKARLDDADDETDITAKMIAVLIGSEGHSLSDIWRNLLAENADGKSLWIDEIAKFGLDDFHWQGTQSIYRYSNAEPSVDDFVLWLFARAWEGFASSTPNEFANIQRDFSVWSNDVRFVQDYQRLAERAASELDIAGQASQMELAELMPRFTFREVDQQVVVRLAQGVEQRTLLDQDVQDAVRRRAAGAIWHPLFEHHYRAIAAASTMLRLIDVLNLGMSSPAEGISRYITEWFAVDQAYRQFIGHSGLAEANSVLEPLKSKVEAFYTSHYLKPLGDAWQQQLDTLDRWQIPGVATQTDFFTMRVNQPFLAKDQKIVVIVSDGLRYELAEELTRRIRQEDKFSAEVSHQLGTFPSYTQLGMAALLPHASLAFTDSGKGLVEIDGGPSDDTERRSKLLAPFGGVAIQANQFMAMKVAEARELVKAHRLVFLYHNQIDQAGDKHVTEGNVFREAEASIQELIRIVKRLTGSVNVNNVLITADHGFLYQESALEESAYLSVKPHGDSKLFTNHRFVLGRGLKRDDAFTTFTPAQLGMSGQVEAAVPKSIHRLRLRGSGVRYVHGGAALQEIVVPVVAVNKKRTPDVSQVAVKIMVETDRITTGQITIRLYQEKPVDEKTKERTLIAGLWAGETLISNEVSVVFSSTSNQSRDRFYTVNLVLSKEADDFNGQTIELRLLTPQRGRYPDTARFTLVRTFTSDFDDWD
jgi:uncharacterized protein (TIGR02687 family)